MPRVSRGITKPTVIRIHVAMSDSEQDLDSKRDTTVSLDHVLFSVATLFGIDVLPFVREKCESLHWLSPLLDHTSLSRYLQDELTKEMARRHGISDEALDTQLKSLQRQHRR